jgi:hypothetical protein
VLRPAQRLVALFIVHETRQVEDRKEHPFSSFLIQVSLYSGQGSVWVPCASTFSTLALRSSVLVYFDMAESRIFFSCFIMLTPSLPDSGLRKN